MVKNHLKRLAAPKSWVVARKQTVFVTKPKPGRSFKLAMPLDQVMKNLIKKGTTRKEVRFILHNRTVLVNGTRVYDHRRPVGFMDVISFPEIDEHYRIILSNKGKLKAVLIDAKEAYKRLLRVSGKSRHKGKFQIHFFDGNNLLVDSNKYSIGDTVVFDQKKASSHLPLKEGACVLLIGGSHLGDIGVIKSVSDDMIEFESDKGVFSTAKKYAFVVGNKEPEVTVR